MYFPSFAGIRKKILFVAFLAFCFVIGAIHNLFAADCSQSLQICKKSCVDRGGFLQFSCVGDAFTITNSPAFRCNCADQFDDLVEIQKHNTSYLKQLTAKVNAMEVKK